LEHLEGGDVLDRIVLKNEYFERNAKKLLKHYYKIEE
jgi:hypothetical protein